jgi:hypothetical protein
LFQKVKFKLSVKTVVTKGYRVLLFNNASKNSPFARWGTKASLFTREINIFPVHWKIEMRVVGLHIDPCKPASVKLCGLISYIEYFGAEGGIQVCIDRSATFEGRSFLQEPIGKAIKDFILKNGN